MSQPGKVLHLYVEVRSVSEEDEKALNGGTGPLMLQCPEMASQRSSSQSSPDRSPELSPVPPRSAGGSHGSLSSRSPSRHSVSFQLQHPQSSRPAARFQHQEARFQHQEARFHHQEASEDGFGHLLALLAPTKASTGPPAPPGCSPEPGPCWGKGAPRSPPSPHWLTVPAPCSCHPRSWEVPETVEDDGRTSLVSFGFIEKGSVALQAGGVHRPDGYLGGAERRMSDGAWCGTSTPGPPQSSWGAPYLSKAATDTVARHATHRALEEFGSPELRRRLACRPSENHSPSLPRCSPAPRCRSWGGSPVLPRSTRTLPSRTELLDLDRRCCHGSVNGLPRSPASDRLCAADPFSSAAAASAPGPPRPAQSHPRAWVPDDHHGSSPFQPSLPAGRPTDIQHDVPRSSSPSRTGPPTGTALHGVNNRWSSKTPGAGHRATEPGSFSEYPDSRSPYHVGRCGSRTSGANSPLSDWRSISPYSIADLDSKAESDRTSAGSADRRYKWTPSPTPSEADSLRSESPKYSGTKESVWRPMCEGETENQNQNRRTEALVPQTKPGRISPVASRRAPSAAVSEGTSASGSPALDPRLNRTSSPSGDRSGFHGSQPAQRHQAAVLEQRQPDHLLGGSPAASAEAARRNTSGPPGSRTPGRQRRPPPVDGREPVLQAPAGGPAQNRRRCCRKEVQGVQKQLAQECQSLVLGLSRTPTGAQGPSRGSVSCSSSGVTGSLGDGWSPEASSRSSHGAADAGSGTQPDRASPDRASPERASPSDPSSRSQKIARAKWEFLFGGPADPGHRSADASSTTPPTSCSPSPTPPPSLRLQPSNQRRGRGHRDQRLSHHEVRQVEVELVAPRPRGPAPNTGVIRRSIKYSETDLDAVPLRCYRETDLDEVSRFCRFCRF
ncbi:uncharacterized protein V3H82_003261 [Fundulus diaphanus]